MTRVAIMQPTYLPWMGYFSLIDKVDVFIFLDSVQFAKRSWQQRNKIKTASAPIWLTVPILSKGKSSQLISEVEIDRSRKFPEKHISSIEYNYHMAPFFSRYSPELFSILQKKHRYLVDLTIELIEWICCEIGVTTPVRRSSMMENTGTKADLLAMLCKQVNATEYMSPPGSRDYLDESNAFQNRGIAVTYHDYIHPEYCQLYGDFIPYMSVIDLLFNLGAESRNVLKSGCHISSPGEIKN